jgi:uncharacterized protein (UPF0548 family)
MPRRNRSFVSIPGVYPAGTLGYTGVVAERLSRSTSIATATRWPVGVALTSWRYLWRTTPMHRSEIPGRLAADAPPGLPAALAGEDDVQGVGDGDGPLFHRRYTTRIRGVSLTPEDLVARLKEDVNAVSPSEFARFHKLSGDDREMAVGDEYIVRMPGPWDGPVRVVDVTPVSWRFLTLEGHLEAGQIEFRAERDGDGLLVFTIESWARAGSKLSNLLYHHLRMSKEVQLHMWTSVLERIVKLSGGRMTGGVEIRTWRVDEPDEQPIRHPRSRRALEALHDRGLNFSPDDLAGARAEDGWRVDDYCVDLPPETPGPVREDGSFAVAKRLMRDYEFADPAIVRAIYEVDAPLETRDMLLVARFHGLRFRFGVRVGAVRDERREEDGRPVHVWGWGYRTLQGHLEMGQMDYEVVKWEDTGDVAFRIHVVSRAARIGNPVVRLGFRLFGRREQVRFARRACERMATLTAAALEGRPVEIGRATEEIAVVPAAR